MAGFQKRKRIVTIAAKQKLKRESVLIQSALDSGAIPYKQWLADQCAKLGLKPTGVIMRISRGKLARPRHTIVGRRVFVYA